MDSYEEHEPIYAVDQIAPPVAPSIHILSSVIFKVLPLNVADKDTRKLLGLLHAVDEH